MEHLFITYDNGIYFLNAHDGYKFYDNTVAEQERTYWTKISLGYTIDVVKYIAISKEEVARLEEERNKSFDNFGENA